jgi:hypothetical protein
MVIATWIAFVRRRSLNLYTSSNLSSVQDPETGYINRENWLSDNLTFPFGPDVFATLISARHKQQTLLLEISNNMIAMGLPPPGASVRLASAEETRKWEIQGWDEVNQTLTYLVFMTDHLIKAYERAASLREARGVQRLTYPALLVPLSVISGYFSMAERFAPGGWFSWIFWALSILAVMITLLLVFTNPVSVISRVVGRIKLATFGGLRRPRDEEQADRSRAPSISVLS